MEHLVYGLPTPNTARQNDSAGIPQVVLAMERYLPEFGYTLTENAASAALIAMHAGSGQGVTDVAHCHGLYPTATLNNTPGWMHELNRNVIQDIRAAKAVTVPSQWVADLLRRDMHIEPHVIGWGVDLATWQHNEPNMGYVLWNKNRAANAKQPGVCDPQWINRLAAKFGNHKFVSTFGEPRANMQITGVMPHAQMQTVIKRAGIYLATTKETGDIGSREALAAGVPVLGFAQGALLDIVQHGVNGFLAEVGDFDGLCAGLNYVMQHRDTLSHNASVLAQSYSWRESVRQIAGVYDEVLGIEHSVKVSVIIPVYNYAEFVGDAIRSACEQECDFEYEVIVIDDGSTDNSLDVIEALGGGYEWLHILSTSNQGVANARNYGIRQARGNYIVCLDADDQIRPAFLAKCAAALDADPSLGIAYSRIEIMGKGVSPWLDGDFNYEEQARGHNQIPTCCMFRRVWWERAGGYRQNKHPAEDADLWLRMTSLGATAKKVTEQPLFVYRMHDDSASAAYRRQEKIEPDWINGKAWIRTKQLPFAAPKPRGAWPVRNYDRPEISIIVPIGPGHGDIVNGALDSIEGQSYVWWETILVNDTGETLDYPDRPYVRMVNTSGKCGAGVARNLGVDAARSKLVTFLDADDFLQPDFLLATYRRYRQTGDYVYTDWLALMPDGTLKEHVTPEFAPAKIYHEGAFHAVTCLLNRQDVLNAGGFDEHLPSWEDVEFFMRLIANGTCGTRIPAPLVVYRLTTGARREYGFNNQDVLKPEFSRRFAEYVSGEKEPVCKCAVKKPNTLWEGDALIEIIYHPQAPNPLRGNHLVKGRATGTVYGTREGGQSFYVYPQDAKAEPERFQVITEIVDEPIVTAIPGEPSAL